jgi:hypothetical protein
LRPKAFPFEWLDNEIPMKGMARMNSVQAEEQAVHDIYHHAASLVRDGKSKPQVREHLSALPLKLQ